jgi:hypothetical protein
MVRGHDCLPLPSGMGHLGIVNGGGHLRTRVKAPPWLSPYHATNTDLSAERPDRVPDPYVKGTWPTEVARHLDSAPRGMPRPAD